MHASRALQSAATGGGFLIPPRTSFDIVRSASKACWSLLFSQDKRDAFANILNEGTIRTDVLGQADMGAAMILALYNDLESPTFSKHGFSTRQFLEGVKPALQEFHNVQGNLQNSLHEYKIKEEPPVVETNKEEEKSKTDENNEQGPAAVEEEAAAVVAAMAGFELKDVNAGLKQVLKRTWEEQAEADKESLAAQLRAMVTPEYFGAMQMSAKTAFLMENMMHKELLYEDGSSEINNVALISARAMEVNVAGENDQEDDDLSEIADEELNVKEEAEQEEERGIVPVAAQVEVLYDVTQTFLSKTLPTKAGEEEKESEQGEDEEEVTRTTVIVGVLEGWLSGDPEGQQELRWRLAANRPAWEFPFMNSY